MRDGCYAGARKAKNKIGCRCRPALRLIFDLGNERTASTGLVCCSCVARLKCGDHAYGDGDGGVDAIATIAIARLRATSYELRATSYELRATSYELGAERREGRSLGTACVLGVASTHTAFERATRHQGLRSPCFSAFEVKSATRQPK
jgi:hypothetical protein